MKTLAAILAFASIATGYTLQNYQKYNDHCHSLECPRYTLLNKTENYEVRKYESFKWATASSHSQTLDYKQASKDNFMKLFRYISGANEQKQKVEMTAPVLIHIPVTQGPFCAPDFTMHFFVPYKFQSNPPKPLNNSDKVSIMELPEMTVFVASFGGWMDQEKIQMNGLLLGKALQEDGIAFDDSQMFTAGYDSPFRLIGRHNEIMFLPKENQFRV